MKRLFAAALVIGSANLGLAQQLPDIPAIAETLPRQAAPMATPQEGPNKLPPITNPPMGDPAPMAPSISPMNTLCNDCNAGPNDGKWHDTHLGSKDAAWMRYEYGYYWISRQTLPTLAINPNGGASLFGTRTGDTGGHVAGALSGGVWMNDNHTKGIYFGGLITEQLSDFQNVNAASINRPFFNVLNVANDSLAAATPGVSTGAMALHSSSRMNSARLGFIWNTTYCEKWNINYMFGFRYHDLDEQISIYQTTNFNQPTNIYNGIAGHPAAGQGGIQNLFITDRFRTRNQFFGFEVGADTEYNLGMFSFGATPKVGFGPIRQSTDVDGSTRFTNTAGAATSVPAGFLSAGAPNGGGGFNGIYGNDSTTRMGLLVDVTGRVGMQVTARMKLTAGYNFLYMTDVSRPALVMNTVMNPSLIPASINYGTLSGPVAPRLTYDRSDFVAHGVTFGIELRY